MNQELEDFKRRVAQVAYNMAKEHELCDVVENALGELGIESGEVTYKVKVVSEAHVTIPQRFVNVENPTAGIQEWLEAEGWDIGDHLVYEFVMESATAEEELINKDSRNGVIFPGRTKAHLKSRDSGLSKCGALFESPRAWSNNGVQTTDESQICKNCLKSVR